MGTYRSFASWSLPVALLAQGIAVGPAAAFDEFDPNRHPDRFSLESGDLRLTLKGELELELHDIEGEGGAGFDPVADRAQIGTRSPYVEIDAFWLALRLELPHGFRVNSILELTPRGAAVRAAWFDWSMRAPDWLWHHAELGFHTPLPTIDRRTERYPLLATIYWREPELHALYEVRWDGFEHLQVEAGVSLAAMRPLVLAPVLDSTGQSGTMNTLGYGSGQVLSGGELVAGGQLTLRSHGGFLTVYGFAGTLGADAGTDALRSFFGRIDRHPRFSRDNPDTRLHWYGGRAGFEDHGLHLWVEGVVSEESILRRRSFYAQLSYVLELPHDLEIFERLEPLVRYEMVHLVGFDKRRTGGAPLRSVAPSQANSWDWMIATLALSVDIFRDIIKVRAEYAFINEHNGSRPAGIPDAPFPNNELLAQIEARF